MQATPAPAIKPVTPVTRVIFVLAAILAIIEGIFAGGIYIYVKAWRRAALAAAAAT